MSKLSDCLELSKLPGSITGAIKAHARKLVETGGVKEIEAEKRAVDHFYEAAVSSRDAILAALRAAETAATTEEKKAEKVIEPEKPKTAALLSQRIAPTPPPAFYSQLQRTLENQPDKASPDQLRAALRKTKQAELREIKDPIGTSFEQWLKENPKASKSEMLDFVRENRVQVKETERGTEIDPKLNDALRNISGEIDNIRPLAFEGLTQLQRANAPNWAIDLARTGDKEADGKIDALPVSDTQKAAIKHYGRLAIESQDLNEKALSQRNETKFHQYQLPGGEKYGETLVTLPVNEGKELPNGFKVFQRPDETDWKIQFPDGRELGGWKTREAAIKSQRNQPAQQTFSSGHWDEPNVVLHLRHNERTLPDGKKAFFLEELQSDWAQRGRKEGYSQEMTKPDVREDENVWVVKYPDGRAYDVPKTTFGVKTAADALEFANEHKATLPFFNHTPNGVPDMPFKGNAWKTLGLKIALRKAIESEAESLGWTTGEQQAQRYDLSKQIDSISYAQGHDGKYSLNVKKDGKILIGKEEQNLRQIEELVGKDITDKISSGVGLDEKQKGILYPNGIGELSGLDLKVGGEGMKGFYDKELVNIANDLGKKWGAKVTESQLDTGAPKPPSWESVGDDGGVGMIKIHSLPITDAMRRDVLEHGQPLFSQPLVPDDEQSEPKNLFEEGLPLARQIANRYTNIRGLEAKDVRSHAQIALARAAQAYDPARGAFLPFARTAINNELRGLYRTGERRREETVLDEASTITSTSTRKDEIADTGTPDARTQAERNEGRAILNEAVATLPDRMQGAINGILSGTTLDEIGQDLGGISRQAVARLATEAMRRLRGKLGEKGISSPGDLLSQNLPANDANKRELQKLDIVEAHLKDTLAAQESADPLQQLIDSLDRDHVEELFDKASSEERGKFETGRADLAGGAGWTGDAAGTAAATRAADQYYTDMAKPRTRATMAKEAEDLIRKTGTQEFASEIAQRWLNGDTLRDSEVMAAKSVLADLSLDTGTPEGFNRMFATAYAYRNIRGNTARDLAAGFDPHKSPVERHREFLAKIISEIPPDKQRAIDAEPDPAKKRDMLDTAARERLDQLERAFSYISKGGVSVQDILSGGWELHGKGAKLLENQIGSYGYDVPHQQALKLAQTATRSVAEIAKATGLSEKEVSRVVDEFNSDLEKALTEKVAAGLTLEKMDLAGALFAQPGNVELGTQESRKSPEEIKAEVQRIIKGMGYGVAAKDLGKYAVKKQKRKLFVPPAKTTGGSPVDAPESGALPYPEGQSAPYTGRVLGQIGLPLYQEMMIRKGADLSNPDEVAKIARVAQAVNGNRADMIYEAWISSILSGPTTHIAYKAALAANTAFEFTIQRGVESLVNLAYRDNNSASFKEFSLIRKALMPAISRGLRIGARQWNTESDIFEQDIMNAQMEMMPGEMPATGIFHKPAISERPLEQFFGPNAVPLENQLAKLGNLNPVRGRVVRIPSRVLWFIDGFYKTLNSQLGVAPIAHRMATREGLTGDAHAERVNELVATPGSAAWLKAADLANWLALRERVKTTAQGGNFIDNAVAQVANARSKSHVLGSQLPFVQLPYNFVKIGMGIAFSPITTAVKFAKAGVKALPRPEYDPKAGLFTMKDGKPFTESYAKTNQIRDLARSFIALTAATILWELVAGDGDDDKKWLLITGSTPRSQLKKGVKELQQRAYGGPYVLRLGGRGGLNFNYGKYEPWATVLGTLADAVIGIKHAARGQLGPKEALDGFAGYLLAQAQDKTFLRSISNIARVLEGEMGITDFAADMVLQGLVPNLIRQPLRNLDDYVRDYKHSSPLYRLFPTAGNAEPKVDLYGKPVEKTGNAFTRMFTIAGNKPAEHLQKADALLLNWNNAHPRDARAPTSPQTTYTGPDGKTLQMTNGQSTKFLEAAGKEFARRVNGLTTRQIEHPQEQDVEFIESAHKDATQTVKAWMFRRRDPTPPKQANVVRDWLAPAA